GGDSLELELKHGDQFGKIALGHLQHPHENLVCREPGNVEPRLKERVPILRHVASGQGLFGPTGVFAGKLDLHVLRLETPEVPPGGFRQEYIAGIGAGVLHVRVRNTVRVSSSMDFMCSSVWVTRMTSSRVVTPFLTFSQPSCRKVRIPLSI